MTEVLLNLGAKFEPLNKNRFKILISSMTLALVGLLLLQFYWISNVHYMAEEKFEANVNKCLQKTVSDLEMAEAFTLMNPDEYYTDIVKSEFGEVMTVQESIGVRDTMIMQNGRPLRFLVVTGTALDTATGFMTQQKVITKDLGQITATEFDNSIVGVNDTNSFAIQLSKSFERQIMIKARYLNEMMRQMFTTNLFDDISFRLNLVYLDSLLQRNLEQFSVDTTYTFNVVDFASMEDIEFNENSKHYSSELVESNYSAKLYPNDQIDHDYHLLLNFPEQKYFLWKEMASTLIGSILLVLIVIFVFYFAVSTIYKQKQLSEIKNDFISNMTHELKTPISTISLACEAVRDPDVAMNEESLMGFMKMIDQENKRLGKLVENVLQTALIDKGKLKLNKQQVQIHLLVKEVVNTFQMKYKERGGEISIERLDDVIFEVDKIHFGNVISNLLDNSLKYSKGEPQVALKLLKDGNGFYIEVKDNGIGIGKEDQKRIYDKLFRVSTGDVHDVKGFGLGLNYVHSIVTLHEGEIELTSALGKGSTFKISIG